MEIIFQIFMFIGKMYDSLDLIQITFALILIGLTIVSITFLYQFFKEPTIEQLKELNKRKRGAL